ncbi:hypothetical protein AB0L74_04080 [Streptomyces sp. NPDC052020]|uniref:hypothetical protein n=1 Tax=Streptomyces sp. NPDC052020 TaxID=3155677 RepID=UPI00342D1C20
MAAWRERLAALNTEDVTAALVVQCDQTWLQSDFTAFRNEVDQALMTAHLRRGPILTITRIILHNLPIGPGAFGRAAAVDRAFDEWHHRLAASSVLLSSAGSATHRIHRLILRGNEAAASVPDMVELLDGGEWTDNHRAESALRMINSIGATTPLTGYDVNLDGPFGDADPSVYM